MGPHRMPAAEVEVSVALVRTLLTDQHPDLAALRIEVVANGWDNLMCRVGDDLIARLPRRAVAAELLLHEQQWLPLLAPRLPLPVPAPVRSGRPGHGYPWSWSLVPLLPGQAAARSEPDDPREAALAVGAFLRALHAPAPPDAPVSTFRGVPLADRAEVFASRVHDLGTALDTHAVTRAWQAALEVPAWDCPPVWLHGDLHPANILVDRGGVSAVIDFGDITSGDPATDLAVAWMLLPVDCHAAFREAYDCGAADDATWGRARGWALALSLALLAHSADNALMAAIGQRTLDAVLG